MSPSWFLPLLCSQRRTRPVCPFSALPVRLRNRQPSLV